MSHDAGFPACDDGVMQHRKTGALIGAALLALAACGSGSDGAAPPVANEPPAASPVADGVSDETEVASTAAPVDEQVDEPVDEPVEAQSDPPAATAASEPDVPAETAAPAAPAEPVVGGRLLAADVQTEADFDANPFPDLVVEDIGKDAQVNIKNILPSDRPVLLWAWAPH